MATRKVGIEVISSRRDLEGFALGKRETCEIRRDEKEGKEGVN